jgi:hypothetical protein
MMFEYVTQFVFAFSEQFLKQPGFEFRDSQGTLDRAKEYRGDQDGSCRRWLDDIFLHKPNSEFSFQFL